jgi:hypothetical protein
MAVVINQLLDKIDQLQAERDKWKQAAQAAAMKEQP